MSGKQKELTLNYIEAMKPAFPAKLYLHIKEYFMSQEFDFDLPAPNESTPKAIRKIHMSDNSCEACES